MQRFYAYVLSTVLLASLCFSPLMIFGKSAKSCPIPPPKTLLSLYLRSDVVVTATVKKEKDAEILSDDENGTQFSVKYTLQVSATFKGEKLPVISFYRNDYREKNPTSEEESRFLGGYGYRGISKPKVGEKYLFFLAKDSETNHLEFTDYRSGVRELNEDSSAVYEARLKELNTILNTKKNQLPQISEWLVKCAEEPATRWDGLFDLTRSFSRLSYEESNKEPITDAEEPIVVDKDFDAGNYSENAKLLTDPQRQRLSGLFFNLVSQTLSQPELLEKDEYFYDSNTDYFANIVKNWDKPQFANYLFGILQSTNSSNKKQITYLMKHLNQIIDDEQLYSIFEKYDDSLDKEDTETVKEESDIEETAEEVKNAEGNTEITNNAEQKIIEVDNRSVMPVSTEIVKSETQNYNQLREKLLQDYASRFQILVTQGFNTDTEQ